MWSSIETIQVTMPDAFRQQFNNCRVIADCTVVFAQTPSLHKYFTFSPGMYLLQTIKKGGAGGSTPSI